MNDSARTERTPGNGRGITAAETHARPILIDEACKILGKAKPTVYTLSRLGEIPSCRQGRKVYFYEDELLEYINSGKVTTAREIRETAEQVLYKGTRRR